MESSKQSRADYLWRQDVRYEHINALVTQDETGGRSMNIDPHTKEFTEIFSLDEMEQKATTDFTQDQLDAYNKLKAEDRGTAVALSEIITAIGPEDHLKALQQDLLKAGYKKLK